VDRTPTPNNSRFPEQQLVHVETGAAFVPPTADAPEPIIQNPEERMRQTLTGMAQKLRDVLGGAVQGAALDLESHCGEKRTAGGGSAERTVRHKRSKRCRQQPQETIEVLDSSEEEGGVLVRAVPVDVAPTSSATAVVVHCYAISFDERTFGADDFVSISFSRWRGKPLVLRSDSNVST